MSDELNHIRKYHKEQVYSKMIELYHDDLLAAIRGHIVDGMSLEDTMHNIDDYAECAVERLFEDNICKCCAEDDKGCEQYHRDKEDGGD